jgi:hypothetical protein
MSFWPVDLRPARVEPEPADRLTFFLLGLILVPLVAAAVVTIVVQGVPGPSVLLPTGFAAGAIASCLAVWRDEPWSAILGLGLGATAAGWFLTFGLGATLFFWTWLGDPCSGPCLP